jgi:hypothetical protein
MHTLDGVVMAEDGSTNDVTIMTSLDVYTLTNDVLGNVTCLVPYLKHESCRNYAPKTNITG